MGLGGKRESSRESRCSTTEAYGFWIWTKNFCTNEYQSRPAQFSGLFPKFNCERWCALPNLPGYLQRHQQSTASSTNRAASASLLCPDLLLIKIEFTFHFNVGGLLRIQILIRWLLDFIGPFRTKLEKTVSVKTNEISPKLSDFWDYTCTLGESFVVSDYKSKVARL